MNRCRRLAKDFEATIQSAVSWIFVAHLRTLTRRIAGLDFKYVILSQALRRCSSTVLRIHKIDNRQRCLVFDLFQGETGTNIGHAARLRQPIDDEMLQRHRI
jgi:hypothetical protein